MPNVEVSHNFRCPGGHCLELCRPMGSNDGGIGSSFGPLQHGALLGASFWVWFSEVGGNFCLRAASNWRSGQGAIRIDILCLVDSRIFVGRFHVSPKHWLGPVGHLRVSLSSSSSSVPRNRGCENPYFVQYPAYCYVEVTRSLRMNVKKCQERANSYWLRWLLVGSF